MESLPLPLIDPDADLRDFAFMPLDVARLRHSRAWLICKRRPELAFYLMNLWTASWHESPAGSLEDDDDVLADRAMCPPKEWPALKEAVMRGWIKCADGRFYHPVVIEKAVEAWKRKLADRYRRECERLRKEHTRSGNNRVAPLQLPTFDEWRVRRTSGPKSPLSAGQCDMSDGQIENSLGHPQDGGFCPADNCNPSRARASYSGDSKTDRDRDIYRTHVSDGQTPDAHEVTEAIRALYPKGTYRAANWILAEREIAQRLEEGERVTVLYEGVQRYAAQCQATGRIGTQYVNSPIKFFERANGHPAMYLDPFPLPAEKPTAMDEINAACSALVNPTPDSRVIEHDPTIPRR